MDDDVVVDNDDDGFDNVNIEDDNDEGFNDTDGVSNGDFRGLFSDDGNNVGCSLNDDDCVDDCGVDNFDDDNFDDDGVGNDGDSNDDD